MIHRYLCRFINQNEIAPDKRLIQLKMCDTIPDYAETFLRLTACSEFLVVIFVGVYQKTYASIIGRDSLLCSCSGHIWSQGQLVITYINWWVRQFATGAWKSEPFPSSIIWRVSNTGPSLKDIYYVNWRLKLAALLNPPDTLRHQFEWVSPSDVRNN